MIVPIKILICVTPEEKILGKSFLKKLFILLSILKFILSLGLYIFLQILIKK